MITIHCSTMFTVFLVCGIFAVAAITDIDIPENNLNDELNGPDFPDDSSHYDTGNEEVTLSTAEVGVARYLGLGYDLMRANPFAATLDPGLKTHSLKPAKLLKTFFQKNATCPLLTQCLKLDTSGGGSAAGEQQIFIRSLVDYQQATLEHLHVYGQFTSNITSAIGSADNSLDSMRNQLSSGTFFTDTVSSLIAEEAELDYRSSQILRVPFTLALCELPLEYHRDLYLSLLKEFGTHVIVKVRLATTSVRRVTITPHILYQFFVDNGVDVGDGYFTSNLSGSVMSRIAQYVGKNDSLKAAVDVRGMAEPSPVVTVMREIVYFVTKERLQKSGANLDNCRHLIQDDTDGTASSKIATIRTNLGRALVDYARDSRRRLQTTRPEFFPWPPEIQAQIAFAQSRSAEPLPDGCIPSADVSLLGRGYDIFGADPLASHVDSGVHFTPALIQKAPCVLGKRLYCSSGLSCANIAASEKSQYAVWSGRDYQKEIVKVLRLPDALPVELTSKISGKSISLQQLSQLFTSGNSVFDTVQLNASSEVSLNYRDPDQILDPHFLSAICELPTAYSSANYISFLKEFGTHIMVKLRYGSITTTRTTIPQSVVIQEITPGEIVTEEKIKMAMEAARKKVTADSTGIFKPNTPILITLRNISYFVTKQRILASNPPPECNQLVSSDNMIASLQSNLNQAMIDYGKEVPGVPERPYPVRTATMPPTTPVARPLILKPLPTTPIVSKPREVLPEYIADPPTKPYRTKPTTAPLTTRAATRPEYVIDEETHGLTWPSGTYTLLEAAEGCPDGNWEKGSRFQDSEDHNNRNDWSFSLPDRTTSKLSVEGVRLQFCSKTMPFSNREPHFPPGEYCVFKKDSCPKGFTPSFTDHDDESYNNGNAHQGTLPDGLFTENTRYYFCCRQDGDPDTPIYLPTGRPFFLLRPGRRCQRVWNMDAEPMWLFTDCEDTYQGCRMSGYGAHPGLTSIHGDWQWHFCYYSSSKRLDFYQHFLRQVVDYLDF